MGKVRTVLSLTEAAREIIAKRSPSKRSRGDWVSSVIVSMENLVSAQRETGDQIRQINSSLIRLELVVAELALSLRGRRKGAS